MMPFAVFIGRFQPFHNGHFHVIQSALKEAAHVTVCVGGANSARRPRNPWTFQERAEMISNAFPNERVRLSIIPINDHIYNDAAWLSQVQSAVRLQTNRASDEEIALVGRAKDRSSYYLKMFPQWAAIPISGSPDMDATAIRDRLFLTGALPGPEEVPRSVLNWLTSYMGTPEARRMREEYSFISKYRAAHDNGQYHRNNVASDAVIMQAGHILLVRRKSLPGAGMLALPGGHVDRDETALDAAMRELREETSIKVPEPVLRGSIVAHRVFDDPYRSDLCRTYSHAYFIHLKNETKLAKVRASSDAESAMWVPLSRIYADQLFDDHYHIINYFTGVGQTAP